jgi:hypothetical protein
MLDENASQAQTTGRRRLDDALQLGPRKKACIFLRPIRLILHLTSYLGWQLYLRSSHWSWPTLWPHRPCTM